MNSALPTTLYSPERRRRKGKDNGEPRPDGYRYSIDTQDTKKFGCPFFLTKPHLFPQCGSFRLSRPCDVKTHLGRCHLLRDVRLDPNRTPIPGDKTKNKEKMEEPGTCTEERDIKLYHAPCRMEFFGSDADWNLEQHTRYCNLQTGADDTGMLLPLEFKMIGDQPKIAKANDFAKWYAIWEVCFPVTQAAIPRTKPASPYIEIPRTRLEHENIFHWALDVPQLSVEYQSLIFDRIMSRFYPSDVQTNAHVQEPGMLQQQEARLDVYGSSTSYPYFPLQSTQIVEEPSYMTHAPSVPLDELQPMQQPAALNPFGQFPTDDNANVYQYGFYH
ncbi:hypothetical protein F53441_14469 [Fusarium austroafricanum]|uniref:Uncharacterized protein n=1 Tax=Fusarium austroafricanum TaxID=2364996 RepID=A0A8H4JCG0_9HYPO|nr:hypothetical protein F53441_14469 [Fusarium austroafricanum]